MVKSAIQAANLADFSADYNLNPFALRLGPLITEVLAQVKQDKERQGTKLVSSLVVWLVLALTIRRDLSCTAVLNWMLSGWRWLSCLLPKAVVAEGTITHARKRVGSAVFKLLFEQVVATFNPLVADFHGWVSVAFDGSTGSMPDTSANRERYSKTNSRREASAYPQMRWVRKVSHWSPFTARCGLWSE